MAAAGTQQSLAPLPTYRQRQAPAAAAAAAAATTRPTSRRRAWQPLCGPSALAPGMTSWGRQQQLPHPQSGPSLTRAPAISIPNTPSRAAVPALAVVPPTPAVAGAAGALQRAVPILNRGGGGGGSASAAAGPAASSAEVWAAPPSPTTTTAVDVAAADVAAAWSGIEAAAAAAAAPPASSAAAGSSSSSIAVAALLRRINSHLPPHPRLQASGSASTAAAAAAAAGGDLAGGSRRDVDAAAAAAVAATNRAQYASAVAASLRRQHRDQLTASDLFLVVHVEGATNLMPGRRGGITSCDPYVKGWLQWPAPAAAGAPSRGGGGKSRAAAAAVHHTPAQKTRVLYINKNPLWHQRLTFGLAGVGEGAELRLQVKDYDGPVAPASVAGQASPLDLVSVLRDVHELGRDQCFTLALKAEDGTSRPGKLHVRISVHEQSSNAQATVLADAMERRATVGSALRGRRLHVGVSQLAGLTGLRGREHDLVLEFRLCGAVVHRPLSCLGIAGGRAQPQQLDGAAAAGGGGVGGGVAATAATAAAGAAAAAAVGPLLAAAELDLDAALREPLGSWAEEQKFGDVHVSLLLHKKKDGGLKSGAAAAAAAGAGDSSKPAAPISINAGEYKVIAKTQVPLWDVHLRPRADAVAAAVGGGPAEATAAAGAPPAVPVLQRALAGLSAAKASLPRGWPGPLLAAAVVALVAAKLMPLLGLLSATAATVVSGVASLAFMLGFVGLAEAAASGPRHGGGGGDGVEVAAPEAPRPQLAQMDLAAPPLVYGRWYSRRMEQLDEAVFRAPAAQAAAAAGVARGMRKAAAAAATEAVEARLVLEIMPPAPTPAAAAAAAAPEVPLPVDFNAPDVDAPEQPLSQTATLSLPGGVPVCNMVVGCGPNATFRHLFAPGSELASRVAEAQGVMGRMVLRPWTAGPSAPPLMSCEMTYTAKSKWPFIPDSAAIQKQEVLEKCDGGWVVTNCILPDVSSGLVAIRVKAVGRHAGPGRTLLTATLTVEHTHETQRSGLFGVIKRAAPGATQGYYAELRKQMEAMGISVSDSPAAAAATAAPAAA
ncbi:hypothetical protein HYH02_005184 [Chlamydomonas schloesseri]|uniref:C2 domain-containing protein n=1 Tax=Chlamydomonas schloesseri TaxID=2026947 RepID=A0A835WL83_9CHLO|nr:hypothetical protein HYH02_005184 [Chlamydomonas schloesseri]|eukprot:KAG2449652.1 hypothetical protein HYH02_005184 [Chlamydomonas schloesseri]